MENYTGERQRLYLNDDWYFSHTFTEDMLQEAAPEQEAGMELVRLPHTNRELGYNYCNEKDYQELMCYRKHFTAKESWKGQVVELTFEGAGHDSTVYVNGCKAAEHHTGYTAFTVDLSGLLHYGGDNVICVRLDARETLNTPPFGKVIDYMTYGGLYREVYLEIHDPVYIRDLYAMPVNVTAEKAELNLQVEVSKRSEELVLMLELAPVQKNEQQGPEPTDTEPTGLEHPHLEQNRISLTEEKTELRIPVTGFSLWEPEQPVLYELSATLLENGRQRDKIQIRTGFRDAVFRADGFYLNGKKLKLRGMDRHQSYPYVGYAMPQSMQEWDADILKKELALNAVRTSHYPQSHYFLNRCDEIGLLVFTEMPGWQHIGDEAWKRQAVENVSEMVRQYRNHPSIILWGVRINESGDDDEFYRKTNEMAHSLDPFRQTGGVRNFAKSHLLEDVYTYNEFVHNGKNQGVDPRKKITPDMNKGYLISEYCGHMFPTKSFDCEEHRLEHAMRHSRILNDAAAQTDIAGSFGWCMFDYNTHQDFGSGDRICYHGILDMFRNPKLAAVVYESQKDASQGVVLEISSNMDIGEHPACYLGSVYAFTNADAVRMYKNGGFIAEFSAKDSPFSSLEHGPILIDDFIGNQLVEKEGYPPKKAAMIKKLLQAAVKYGFQSLPFSAKLLAARLILFHGMKYEDGVELYGKYIGNWGGYVTSYRFDAVVDGKVVKSVTKTPSERLRLKVQCSQQALKERSSYDVAAFRLSMRDQNNNLLSFYQEPVQITLEGPAEIIGPSVISLKGGMGGSFIRTTGEAGTVTVKFSGRDFEEVTVPLEVTLSEGINMDEKEK